MLQEVKHILFPECPLHSDTPPLFHAGRTPTVLAIDAPITYNVTEPRHKTFLVKLNNYQKFVDENGLLGFRVAQAEACSELKNLDARERQLLLLNFQLSDQPLKRLLNAAILNAEFRRDNLNVAHSGTEAARKLFKEGLSARDKEFATLFRGLNNAVDQCLSNEARCYIDHEANYFTPQDTLFRKIIRENKVYTETFSTESIIGLASDLASKIAGAHIGNNRLANNGFAVSHAFEMLKDTYLFGAVSGQELSTAFYDKSLDFKLRVLLSGAMSELDTGTKNSALDTSMKWLTKSSLEDRNLSVLFNWGSDSSLLAERVVKLLSPNDAAKGDPASFEQYFFDVLMLGCTLTPGCRFDHPVELLSDNLANIYAQRAAVKYDQETIIGFTQQPTATELKIRRVQLDFDLDGMKSAKGAKKYLQGCVFGRMHAENEEYRRERQEDKPAAIAATVKEDLASIFSLRRAREVAQMIAGGLTQNLLAEEVFYSANSSGTARIAAPSTLGAGAYSMLQAQRRKLTF